MSSTERLRHEVKKFFSQSRDKLFLWWFGSRSNSVAHTNHSTCTLWNCFPEEKDQQEIEKRDSSFYQVYHRNMVFYIKLKRFYKEITLTLCTKYKYFQESRRPWNTMEPID